VRSSSSGGRSRWRWWAGRSSARGRTASAGSASSERSYVLTRKNRSGQEVFRVGECVGTADRNQTRTEAAVSRARPFTFFRQRRLRLLCDNPHLRLANSTCPTLILLALVRRVTQRLSTESVEVKHHGRPVPLAPQACPRRPDAHRRRYDRVCSCLDSHSVMVVSIHKWDRSRALSRTNQRRTSW
jgi:hypothetical protein